MKNYKIVIRFTTDYLQARFCEKAKEELENYISQGIVKSEEDSWKVLLYEDEKGIYIPNQQIRGCLIAAGTDFKYKKTRKSMKQWAISHIIIDPLKIHLDKKKPDFILQSNPPRKDGNRVSIKHPAFTKKTEIKFELKCLDDTMEDKAIKDLIEKAGIMYGIGARRRDMFGRFELIKFEKNK